jgi:hypothetical protein
MDTNKNNSVYEDGQVYKAKVIDQLVTRNDNQEPQLVLGIKISAKLKNNKNPSDGSEECQQLEREVRITIVEDDYDRLRMAVRDLERLGFADDDITRLHPEHPEHYSLLDKEVHARMKTVNETEYWNFAWPREKPKPMAAEDWEKAAASLKEKIAQVKQRMKEDRGRKKGQTTDVSPTTASPPDVAY